MSEAATWISRPAPLATGTPYAERPDRFEGALDRAFATGWGRCRARLRPGSSRLLRIPDLVERQSRSLAGLSDDGLRQAAAELRSGIVRRGVGEAVLVRAFALVREATGRRVGFRHHPVQLMGGWAMLTGALAEMRTGEGKTITAALPASVAALAGGPVHVITVNSYLAERDFALLAPVYDLLGLRAGLVTEDAESAARRAAYACDITYATNKDVAFDYLRDRVGLRGDAREREPPILRGLGYAVIDEADSILIDEARTPLILSRSEAGEQGPNPVLLRALELAGSMQAGEDFEMSATTRAVTLTERAIRTLNALSGDGPFGIRRARHELVVAALRALHVYRRDRDYIVADGKICIVDESTGRAMPDRAWEGNLHQLIEAKEGCARSGRRHTIARLTYQRFFRRYLRLCGMTGTAVEAAGELWSVYGLKVVRIPSHRPDCRRDLGSRMLGSQDGKWAEVAKSAQRISGERRPLLIGTRSVGASERISAVLTRLDIPHSVLNARQDGAEAAIVSEAGQAGRITVATNMAGRGTDIHLPPEVARLGGLHVILTEFHESSRVDRQLIGRCGRQGDRGSFEAIVSCDDEMFRQWLPGWLTALLVGSAVVRSRSLTGLVRKYAQWRAERHYGRLRRRMIDDDLHLERRLAFSGRSE